MYAPYVYYIIPPPSEKHKQSKSYSTGSTKICSPLYIFLNLEQNMFTNYYSNKHRLWKIQILDTKLERFNKCLELEHSNLFSEFNFFAEDNFYEFLHQRRKIIGKICSQFLVCTANLIDKVFLVKKLLSHMRSYLNPAG